MGRPFLAYGDDRCEPVAYDPERPLEPGAFALSPCAINLLHVAAIVTYNCYDRLTPKEVEALLVDDMQRLRMAVPCARTFSEALAGLFYFMTDAHVKARRCAPEAFWDRLFDAFAENTHVVIRMVSCKPDRVVLRTLEPGGEVTCEHGRVVAFMGHMYHEMYSVQNRN